MTEPMLSVCWKNHTSELATVYQSLLENNFLVDCTLSAEGRSLKAHRLVLSACSPYFHKLFHEETGKHPFVVLLNASFETLKAVIDFVYRGEAQISTVGLKEFLTLAQYLRIKGLNAFTQEYVNKIVSRNATGNVYIPSEDNQDTQEVQDVSGSRKNNLEYSSQPHPHLSGSFADTVHTHSSVPFEAHSASCEEEQSVMPPQEHQRLVGYNEMSEDTEVTVKHEPFFSAYSETRNRKVDNIKQSESVSESYMSEMDGGSTFVTGEEDLHQYPSGSRISHGNVESSMIASPQQQLMQLSSEVPSGRNVEQHQPVLPAILVPKSEQMDDADNEKSMEEYVLGYNTNETDEGTRSPCGEQNLNQSSSAVERPQAQATTRRGGQRGRRPPERSTSAAASGPDGTPSGRSSRKLHFRCGECPASFSSHQCLVYHKRAHTGGRLFRCDVCHIAFTKLSTLVTHSTIHTGERAYRCDVCGKAFNRSNILSRHKRAHTGERPYSCHVCGMAFSQTGSLARHLITAHNVTPRGRQPARQVNSSTGADAQGGGRNS